MEKHPVTVVAHHVRTGVTALNVVTGALADDVDVRFGRSADETADLARDALNRGARVIVAFSFYSPDARRTVADMRQVHAACGDDVLLVAGGVHATAEPRQVLEAGFHVAAVGEGEHTLVSLVDAWRAEPAVPRVSGTWTVVNGKPVNHGAPARHALDAYPACNLRHGRWNAIEITRGCIYACSFCQTPYVFKARFRHRSVENVRHHVAEMVKGGLRYVRFLTPTCLSYGSPDHEPNLDAVDLLLAAVREELGPDGELFFGTFPSECRPEHVTPEAMRILKRWVNNDGIIIGGQSGSDAVLERLHRGHSVAEVERAVRVALEAGFRPDVDFIVGLPGESAEEQAATISFAQRLVEMGARVHSHAFMPLPGTPTRDAEPSAITREARDALGVMEAHGDLYGSWRKQEHVARDLVQIRRHGL